MITRIGRRRLALATGTQVSSVTPLVSDSDASDVIVVAYVAPAGVPAVIDVRRYFHDEESDTFRPTSKGIRLALAIADDIAGSIVSILTTEGVL